MVDQVVNLRAVETSSSLLTGILEALCTVCSRVYSGILQLSSKLWLFKRVAESIKPMMHKPATKMGALS